ncbi:N-acyl-D-amino-acid deacylase family protein [Novosphingobium sp.]|uniref:N-acyl-D-amino-acid deacylase family protein n=1 Tax=Novosphingobium sp. TaxID=1874826 RepID=UPI003BA8D517
MSTFDLVIKNATIVDGSRMPRFYGDLAIKHGRIERIGVNIPTDRAARVIEAGGKIVAPGVIDIHTHYDAQLHWDPLCTGSSWHGATTAVLSNCGFGFAPCRPQDRGRYMQMMENTEQIPTSAMVAGMNWDWESFPDWMAHLARQAKGVNLAAYVPLNALLLYVAGNNFAKGRALSATEKARARDILHHSLDAGAIGFSMIHLGTTNSHVDFDGSPMPTDVMAIEDAHVLAEVLRERDQGIIQITADTAGAAENRHVSAELARIARRPVLHNVVFASGLHPDHHRTVLGWIDKTAAEGVNLFGQGGTFRAWLEFNALDFNGWDSDPNWSRLSTAGDRTDKLRLVGDPAYRTMMRREYDPKKLGASGSIESFELINAQGVVPYVAFEGRTMGDISSTLGQHVVDFFFDLLIATNLEADFTTGEVISYDTDSVAEILANPRVLPGISDSGAHSKFYNGAQYPTDLITWMVRDEARLSLEDAHYKLSGLPAHVLSLDQRGLLREGYAADLYIYDFDALDYVRGRYDVLHDTPGGHYRRVVRAQGISHVIVNGELILENTVATGNLPGRLVANGGAALDARINAPAAMAGA